jgi:hypothetical protein
VVEFVNVFLSIFLATVSYLQLLHQYIDLLLKKYIYLKGTKTQVFCFSFFSWISYPSAKIVTLKWFLTKWWEATEKGKNIVKAPLKRCSDCVAFISAFVPNPHSVYVDTETPKCFGSTASNGFTLNTRWWPINTEPVFVNV